MKKILLLGSGELGKEFVISAQRKGQYIIACDSYAGAPSVSALSKAILYAFSPNPLCSVCLTAMLWNV